MYPASDAFHQAVANGNEQKALLIFSDCVFTDEDISIDNGIEFHEYFNTEEDLSIGQATSNEISFSLFNDARLLNNYAFGDFLATLGVYIGSGTYSYFAGNVTTRSKTGSVYCGYSTAPYLTRAGTEVENVNFPVLSILAYNDVIFAFGEDGRFAAVNNNSGRNITRNYPPLNSFMVEKVKKWTGKGICYRDDVNKLFFYNSNGTYDQYEFVPLGHFTAERPKAPDRILIDMTCYDYMQKFERDMPDAAAMNITYPTDIQVLFGRMCQYLGVSFQTGPFINSDAMIVSEPEEFRNATMRDVLKWIAEAAGSNARFDRDGKLVLDWIRSTELYYTASDYMEFNPYWYKTPKVTKLYNRDTTESTEHTVGSGTEAYLIQDNPLLKGAS